GLLLGLRRLGWRKAGASLLAGVIPVAGYVGWFAAAHGSANLTNSNGLFLWSRTMSFADCAVIRPPADLRALCPDAQPGHLAQPDPSRRPQPKFYLWNHDAWQWRDEPSGFVPATAAFTQANNDRALRFAIMATEAQPFSYIGAVTAEIAKPFVTTANTLRFPTVQRHSLGLVEANQRYAVTSVLAYLGSTQSAASNHDYDNGTRLVSPFASLMGSYQRIIFLPGQVFGLIVLTGLAGLILPPRPPPAGLPAAGGAARHPHTAAARRARLPLPVRAARGAAGLHRGRDRAAQAGARNRPDLAPHGRGAAGPRGAGQPPPMCGSPVISVIVLPFGAWSFGL